MIDENAEGLSHSTKKGTQVLKSKYALKISANLKADDACWFKAVADAFFEGDTAKAEKVLADAADAAATEYANNLSIEIIEAVEDVLSILVTDAALSATKAAVATLAAALLDTNKPLPEEEKQDLCASAST